MIRKTGLVWLLLLFCTAVRASNLRQISSREGKFVTSRQIRDRLQRELLKDVALKVEDSATSDSFRVMGRGEMHLSILIENLRREGYEFQVGAPKAMVRMKDVL